MHDEETGQGQDQHGISGQEPITVEGYANEAEHRDPLPHDVVHGAGHGAFDQGNVIDHAGYPRTRVMRVQIRQGHTLHMRKELIAHITNDVLANRTHQVRMAVGQQAAHDVEEHNNQGKPRQFRGIAIDKDLVQHRLHQ